MPDEQLDLDRFVTHFLPFDGQTPEAVIDQLSEADLTVLIVASFTTAARQVLPKLGVGQREMLCRRVAKRCEVQVQVWMVEALLRAAESDRSDFVVQIPGDAMSEIQVVGLMVLSTEHLDQEECERLHDPAAEYARALQPLMAAAHGQAAPR